MTTKVKNAVIGLIILLTTALNVHAGEGLKGAELISLGKKNNLPVFQLKINNKENGKYAVIIKDQHGETLYKGVIKGVNISKNFLLNTEDVGATDVSFEVVDLDNSTSSTVFNVKNNMRLITETVITKE